MILSAVSVLVVAQSSSEIPEGLMNNPVFIISSKIIISHLRIAQLNNYFSGPLFFNHIFIDIFQDFSLKKLWPSFGSSVISVSSSSSLAGKTHLPQDGLTCKL